MPGNARANMRTSTKTDHERGVKIRRSLVLTKNSRATSWKRSHKILISVPSGQVHIVDCGHFFLDTAPDEITATST